MYRTGLNSALQQYRHSEQDPSGYSLDTEELYFGDIGLKWGSCANPEQRVYSFKPRQNAIVSHFRLADPAPRARSGKDQSFREKHFVVFREAAETYELSISPTYGGTRRFFELMLSEQLFKSIFTPESDFMNRLGESEIVNRPLPGFCAAMQPNMYAVINEMKRAPYSGSLKGLYLEAKSIELFLSQVSQLDKGTAGNTKLKPADKEALYAVKSYIDAHYQQACSIVDLARMACINQTKLKTGFKALFGNTVFAYISDLRMQEAKKLLLDEKLPVGEVADKVGYAHAHHFAVAFRKKFGVLPGSIKLL
ncbi:AraC-type DNA-binding protein [Chitinophaga rupis]|uniref:AraC-type DNA-binding protein n=1 Tax=Chitinophaga rupis TaxID=573321 RepID=A0A1H8DWR5_9BACT|nr:AraC family transcriptional regulator [Chitinophaga rupis]SEN11294.1 AraC-type DNA-binding protein [Chitinophaga rupis]